MGTLNDIITIVAIALKKGESLEPLIKKYGNEMIADAMQFINYENREILEPEEDYDNL
jgi:nickel-dependent lactate racemase